MKTVIEGKLKVERDYGAFDSYVLDSVDFEEFMSGLRIKEGQRVKITVEVVEEEEVVEEYNSEWLEDLDLLED